MSGNVGKNICDAIDVIVNKKITSLNFDKTVQGSILSIIDKKSGQYEVKYQDSAFIAYTSSLDTYYTEGDSVYILIPSGDFNNNKTILGTTAMLSKTADLEESLENLSESVAQTNATTEKPPAYSEYTSTFINNLYFFIRYADDTKGTNFVTTPQGSSNYIGFYGSESTVASTNYSDYQWRHIVNITDAEQTVNINGFKGKQEYLHIAYSEDGINFTVDKKIGPWRGTYADYVLADSTDFSDYTWRKIYNEDGLLSLLKVFNNKGIPFGDGLYLHVQFGDKINPSTLLNVPALYIGTYVDNVESNSEKVSSYRWFKFQSIEQTDTGIVAYDNNLTKYFIHLKYSDDKQDFTAQSGEVKGKYLGYYVNNSKYDKSLIEFYTFTDISALEFTYNPVQGLGEKSFSIYYSNTDLSNEPYIKTELPNSNSNYILIQEDSKNISKITAYAINTIQAYPGIIYYLHTKFSNDGELFTSSNGEGVGHWIGFYIDDTLADSTTFSDYSWIRYSSDVIVGGVNLLRGTKAFDLDSTRTVGWYYTNDWETTLNTSSSDTTDYQISTLRVGYGQVAADYRRVYSNYIYLNSLVGITEITISDYFKVLDSTIWDNKTVFVVNLYDSNNVKVGSRDITPTTGGTNMPLVSNNTYTRLVATVTLEAGSFLYSIGKNFSDATKIGVDLVLGNNGRIYHNRPQLEIGNTVTDYKENADDSIDEIRAKTKQAQESADNAQSTANNAQGTATIAQGTAIAAVNAASSAQTTANNAQTTANNTANTVVSVQASMVTMGQAIDDAAVSVVTNARLVPGSLSVWPFQNATIPSGALVPGSIGSNDIADFSLLVTKLNDTQHHLY